MKKHRLHLDREIVSSTDAGVAARIWTIALSVGWNRSLEILGSTSPTVDPPTQTCGGDTCESCPYSICCA